MRILRQVIRTSLCYFIGEPFHFHTVDAAAVIRAQKAYIQHCGKQDKYCRYRYAKYTNLYPTPQTVISRFAFFGSSPNFCRSRLICT